MARHRPFAVLLACLCSLFAAEPRAQTRPAERPADRDLLRLVADLGSAPMMYGTPDGARGYAVEIGRAVLETAGFAVVAEAMPWPRAQDETLNNGAVITGFSYTDERVRRGFLYSIVVFKDPIVAVRRKDAPLPYAGPEDLFGRRIGVARGTRYGAMFEAWRPRMILDEDGSDAQRVQKLNSGRLDFGLFTNGEAALQYVAQRHAMEVENLVVLSPPLLEDELHLAVGRYTPNAERIVERMNAAIRTLTADGTIARLQRRP